MKTSTPVATPTPTSTTTPSDIKTSAQADPCKVGKEEEVEVATSQYFTAGSKTNTNN
jgi:hypothetical protein